jgi:hypothetical protein
MQRRPLPTSFLCLDVPARTLNVEANAWLIANDPGIMTWRGNSDIPWAEIGFCAIVHHYVNVPGNDIAKMCYRATLRAYGGFDML